MTLEQQKAAIAKLMAQGFVGGPIAAPGVDFVARDYGQGPRLEWLSDKPCPFPEMLDA